MTAANLITLSRFILALFFVVLILLADPVNESIRLICLGLFLAASLTDALDGFVARKTGAKTMLGTILDPIADKILLLSAFLAFAFVDTLPLYLRAPKIVAIAVLCRDMLIIGGCIFIYRINKKIHITPSPIGKITTFLQTTVILLMLLKFSQMNTLLYCVAVVTVISGIDYVYRGVNLLKT
ncbi:MAG: CDP-alcohol phosphatidyltransferase family protein [Candidatus Omnitrophica bacterium]|nr:CDP-alcohol phosphatidyltransferase family protein [Candidatus Omnitrophota bacterium]